MSAQNRYSVGCKLRQLYVHVVLNSVIFPQTFYDIVRYARRFLPGCQVFSQVLL